MLTFLNLANNNLQGPIPASFSQLQQLQTIAVDNNNMTGTVEMLASLSNLQLLDLDTNSFYGTIPFGTELIFIQEVFLQRNQFTGPFPGGLLLIPSLVLLDVSNNQLTGGFPMLPVANAAMVRAASNQLTGPLPSATLLRKVYYVDLSANQFSGTVPDYSIDGAFSMDVHDSPLLLQPCAVVLAAQAVDCLAQ